MRYIALTCFVVFGIMSTSCTKTDTVIAPQYDTVYVKQLPDTGKQNVVILRWSENSAVLFYDGNGTIIQSTTGVTSDCDVYVNGDFYNTIFQMQVYDTLKVPVGAKIEARYMYGTNVAANMVIWDTVASKLMPIDTSVNCDTLYWLF